MNQPARSSVMLLALAGLGSALFTVMVTLAGYSLRTSEGLDFGVALAAYFVWYEGYRDSIKLLAFICACIAAHFVAALIAFLLLFVFVSMSRDTIEMPIYFGWGCVGAFIVLAAGIFLFSPRSISWKSLTLISLWSLGGGVLGAIAVGPYAVRSKYLWFFPPLVWQPGTAMLLGLLLERERRAMPKPSPAANS
jgi:FtsH-binding integral membrane protein